MSWKLVTNSGKESTLQGDIVVSTRKEKSLLAIKKLVLFWALSIISIAIPVLHFVLVPTFFFVGLVAFFSQNKNTHYIKMSLPVCPECGQSFSVQNLYVYDGKKINCASCMTQLRLVE